MTKEQFTNKKKTILIGITTILTIILLIIAFILYKNNIISKAQLEEHTLKQNQITQINTNINEIKNIMRNQAKEAEIRVEAKTKEATEETKTNRLAEETTEQVDLTKYYEKAEQTLKNLTQEEIIAQIFLVGTFQNSNIQELKQKQFGGYLFFTDFFKDKTEKQIQTEIENFQNASKIPLLIAVDEEGGKVVRASNNKKLIKEQFENSSDIYKKGGFEAITKDTINKSKFLANLGINLNLAPVVDIATNPKAYIYNRSFKQGVEQTSTYAKTVIKASKTNNVSYTLKHFPGYGNNTDTHKSTSTDQRTYEDIYNNDLEPFREGIKAGAEAILISHNTVTNIDAENPASFSPKIHKLLKEDLQFKGITITDSINMGAIKNKYTTKEAIIKSILAGNDMIIILIDKSTTESYDDIINIVKEAINNRTISYDDIYKSAKNIIAWKYYKGMIK